VRLRDADFRTRQASRTLLESLETDRGIYAAARPLLTRLRAERRIGARLVGVSASNLVASGDSQLALFEEGREGLETERDRRLAHATDALRARFGREVIRPAELWPGRREAE
jgi:DNA polymerase IV